VDGNQAKLKQPNGNQVKHQLINSNKVKLELLNSNNARFELLSSCRAKLKLLMSTDQVMPKLLRMINARLTPLNCARLNLKLPSIDIVCCMDSQGSQA
jgi:hypothetical protein